MSGKKSILKGIYERQYTGKPAPIHKTISTYQAAHQQTTKSYWDHIDAVEDVRRSIHQGAPQPIIESARRKEIQKQSIYTKEREKSTQLKSELKQKLGGEYPADAYDSDGEPINPQLRATLAWEDWVVKDVDERANEHIGRRYNIWL